MEEANEHQLLRDQDRAAQAEALLNNTLLNEAFTSLEARYMAAWRNTGLAAADTLARERLFQAVNIIGKVQEHLGRVIAGGKLAKKQLEEIERRKELGVSPFLP